VNDFLGSTFSPANNPRALSKLKSSMWLLRSLSRARRLPGGSSGSRGNRHWRRVVGSPSVPAGARTRKLQRPEYGASDRVPDSTRDSRRRRGVPDRLGLRRAFFQEGVQVRQPRKGGWAACPTSAPKPGDQRPESRRAIAEPVSDLVQRKTFEEDCSEGLVATMGALSWFEEEATAHAVIHDVGSWC